MLQENINNIILSESLTNENLKTEEGVFSWTKQWYPVAVVEFLDPGQDGDYISSVAREASWWWYPLGRRI
jgi:hypothetical protein